jgi:hypothetical protein
MNEYFVQNSEKTVQICGREFEETLKLFGKIRWEHFEDNSKYHCKDWFGNHFSLIVYYKG